MATRPEVRSSYLHRGIASSYSRRTRLHSEDTQALRGTPSDKHLEPGIPAWNMGPHASLSGSLHQNVHARGAAHDACGSRISADFIRRDWVRDSNLTFQRLQRSHDLAHNL